MTKYGLDLEKVEAQLMKLVSQGDEKAIANFAKETIPLLIEDSRKTRVEVINGLLKKY